MGGGAEASVNGDIVIGCEGAKFGFPEVLRGSFVPTSPRDRPTDDIDLNRQALWRVLEESRMLSYDLPCSRLTF